MRWKGRRQSSNVEDARGRSAARTGASAAGAAQLLNFVGRRFGIKGIIVVVIGFFLLSRLGILGGGGGAGVPMQSGSGGGASDNPVSNERLAFVSVTLADTEDVWNQIFQAGGQRYVEPQMQVYTGRTNTACGAGSASMGPFYCPADQKVYIDLGFYDELEQTFQAPGDFAQAYVIAHEVGHHVQNLLGTSGKVNAMRNRPDYNQYSVRLELQADCYAGVWANHNQRYLDAGDIEEAVRAANAIGDDAIQGRMQGKVVPHTFTHGTSEQRMRWFNQGYKSGSPNNCDTFAGSYEQL